jgi:putative ABC transport system permease protein
MNDLRYAVRQLVQHRGFTAVAVLTLALGIGANAALYSVVRGVLLKPLPFPDARALTLLREVHLDTGNDFEVSYPNFADLRRQATAFAGLSAFTRTTVTFRGAGADPARVEVGLAARALFATLGVPPWLGRGFTDDDQRPGAPPTMLVTHRFWASHLRGDSTVVGRVLRLNRDVVTVIGVLPPGFDFPDTDIALWVPLEATRDQAPFPNRRAHILTVIGRLDTGISLDRAALDVRTVAARLQADDPGADPQHGLSVTPLHDAVVGDARATLLVLLGAVGFVLLLACVNVADLMLARSAGRQREVAIRASLGAGPWRIARQILLEAVLLSTAGAAVGLALAWWAVETLTAGLADWIPRPEAVALDLPVLVATLVVAVGTGVAFGLAPAFRAAAVDMREALVHRAPGGTGGGRLRSALTVAQVAISLVLLAGAGLSVQSLVHLQRVDPGFDPRNLLTMTVSLSGSDVTGTENVVAFYRALPGALRAVPGVTAVSGVNVPPISGGDSHGQLSVEGSPLPPGDEPSASYRRILPDYFRTMGIPLLRGRDFTPEDGTGNAAVVIVNDALVRRAFPAGGNPLGQRIKVGTAPTEPWLTIVGVVGDVHNEGLASAPRLATYEPHPQRPWTTMTIIVRTAVDPLSVVGPLRQVVHRAGGEIPVYDITTMPRRIAASLRGRRFTLLLLGAFAGTALALAAVGLYGVIAYGVTRRTHEFGVRVALGARASSVARLVLRQGMTLVGLGMAIGVPAAAVLTRGMRTLLHGVAPSDPGTLVTVCGLLLVVALLAAWLPARRAARVAPMEALRHE